jgi:hypothetical protein
MGLDDHVAIVLRHSLEIPKGNMYKPADAVETPYDGEDEPADLREQEGLFLAAGRAEVESFAGEGAEILVFAVRIGALNAGNPPANSLRSG